MLSSHSGRVKRTLLSDLGPTPGHWTMQLRLVEKGDDLLFANDRLQHIPAQIPTVNGAVVL